VQKAIACSIDRHDLAELPTDDWRTLRSAAGVYAGRRWLSLQADDPAYESGMLVASGVDGTVLGVLPMFQPRTDGLGAYGPRLFDGMSTRFTPRQVVYWGSVGGHRADVILSESLEPDSRSLVERTLWEAAADYSKGLGRVAVVPYSMTAAPADGWRREELTSEASLSVPNGYDEWLRSLTRNRRTSVRREERELQQDGWTFAVRPLGEVLDPVSHLLADNQKKYGRPSSERLMKRVLGRLVDHYVDDAVVFAAECRGQIEGFSLGLVEGDVFWIRAAGASQGADRFVYFGCTFYAPIRWTEDRALTAIHLGVGSLAAKQSRGAVLSSLFMDIADRRGVHQ
jgi:hypothetical protein